MLVNIAYYNDALDPVQILSLALQKKEVIMVNSANSLLKTKSSFVGWNKSLWNYNH